MSDQTGKRATTRRGPEFSAEEHRRKQHDSGSARPDQAAGAGLPRTGMNLRAIGLSRSSSAHFSPQGTRTGSADPRNKSARGECYMAPPLEHRLDDAR
jgi:hypothetical protein